MKILKSKIKKEKGQLLKLSQAGSGCVGGTSCASSDEAAKFTKKPIILRELRLRRGKFISELGFTRTHPLQTIFRAVQARTQVVNAFGHDIVVIGVPTQKLAVLGILRTLPEGVETSWAARTGMAHPATATVLAVRSSIMVGVLVPTILFGAVAVWHRHLLSKVLWFGLLSTIYIKSTQKVKKNKNRNFLKFLFKKFILKNFSFLLLQNMVRANVFTGSLAVFRFAAKPHR